MPILRLATDRELALLREFVDRIEDLLDQTFSDEVGLSPDCTAYSMQFNALATIVAKFLSEHIAAENHFETLN